LAAAYAFQLTAFRRTQSKGRLHDETIHQYRQMSLLQCTRGYSFILFAE
jgi:hypothetical protein